MSPRHQQDKNNSGLRSSDLIHFPTSLLLAQGQVAHHARLQFLRCFGWGIQFPAIGLVGVVLTELSWLVMTKRTGVKQDTD